jgi:NTE family protein
MPYLLSYFVNGLARDAASSADLMSYLLFTSRYTSALIDLGYHDADKRIDEIEDLLYSGKAGSRARRSAPAPRKRSRA